MALIAYHNDAALKESVVAEMAAHRKADNLVQGYGYWFEGKGCAVGCLIKSSNHEEYETRFGIPQMLANLEDVIFEGLPVKDAKKWPERFLKAITPGSDLSLVGWKFLYWNLTENLVIKDSDDSKIQKVIIQCRKAIKECGEAVFPLTKKEKIDLSATKAAWSGAADAAEAAWSAAAEEAWSASWSAEAAKAARSVAWSALGAERSAAWSARAAEEAALEAENSAEWPAAWIKMADKIIELLEEAV